MRFQSHRYVYLRGVLFMFITYLNEQANREMNETIKTVKFTFLNYVTITSIHFKNSWNDWHYWSTMDVNRFYK